MSLARFVRRCFIGKPIAGKASINQTLFHFELGTLVLWQTMSDCIVVALAFVHELCQALARTIEIDNLRHEKMCAARMNRERPNSMGSAI